MREDAMHIGRWTAGYLIAFVTAELILTIGQIRGYW